MTTPMAMVSGHWIKSDGWAAARANLLDEVVTPSAIITAGRLLPCPDTACADQPDPSQNRR